MVAQLNTVGIIQARMGSTRLPGKILMDFCGLPILEVLIKRACKTVFLNKIVVATTFSTKDDFLCNWLSSKNIPFYRGSEEDVLDRFWQCSKFFKADIVVRLTADDPLKDPEIIDWAVREFKSRNVDYVSNTLDPTFPEGLDVEVFSFEALDKAAKEAKLKSEREHVTPYMWKNTDKFKTYCIKMEPNLSDWRWTVDKNEDLVFLNEIMSNLGSKIHVSYKEIIKFIQENKEFLELYKRKTLRNEGYIKSINHESKNGQ